MVNLKSLSRGLCAATALLLAAASARADIVFDAATPAEVTGTTLTFSHTIGGGSNRLLVLCITVEAPLGNSDLTAAPTYDGVDMTKAIDHVGGTSFHLNTEIWYMLEAQLPPAGPYQVSIEAASGKDITAAAISVRGADQQGPEATAVNDDGQAGAPSIQTQITTITDRAWIFDCVGSGNAISGFTPDAGQNERYDLVSASSRGAASTEEKTTAGLETQGWTITGTPNRLVHVVAAFAQSPTINYRSVGTDTATLYSIGTASVGAGTNVVTFAGGANLPTNIGPGDVLTIADSTPSVITVNGTPAAQTFSGVTVASMSYNIVAAPNRVLIVCTGVELFPPPAVTGVTYNGVAMTQAGFQEGGPGTVGQRTEMWYMLESDLPPSGSYTVEVTYAASVSPGVAVMSLTGVAQQAPEATNGNECVTCTPISTNITTLTDDAWVVSTVSNGQSGSYTHGTGPPPQIERWDYTPSSMVHSGSTLEVASAGLVTIQEIASVSANRQAHFVAAYAAAVTTDTVLHILSRDSATQVTAQEMSPITHTNDTYTITRAYNTFQAWENDRQGDLVAGNRREVAVAYDDNDFTAGVVILGSTTDTSRYMMITVADGQRHAGKVGNGVLVDAQGGSTDVIDIRDPYTVVEWLALTNFSGANTDGFRVDTTANNALGRYLLIYDFGISRGALLRTGVTVTMRNSIIYNGAIAISVAGATGFFENLTIRGMSTAGISSDATGTVSIRNVISVGSGVWDMDLLGTESAFDYNMYGTLNGAVAGSNDQSPPIDLEDLFISIALTAEDLHLEPTGHTAGNAGLDLSSAFTDDIDAEIRTGAWDIGADEASSPKPKIVRWREIDPN